MNIKPIFAKTEPITLQSYMEKCGVNNIDEYLKAQYLEPLENYDNIEQAAKILLDAIIYNKIIYLIADSDSDGYFSCGLQYAFLKKCNPNLPIKVLFHNKNAKAHGFEDDEIMEQLIAYGSGIEGVNAYNGIIWMADAGSNNTKECRKLAGYGFRIICSDHHNKSDDNPYALIVNNQYSDKVTNKQLSGCGVTFKLCQMIDKLYKTNYSNEFISYVHFTNISDSCGFTHPEQQTFRYWGLQNIHPYIKSFIDAFNYKGGLNNMDFSFGAVSRINAVIRVGTLEQKQTLFKALAMGEDVEEAIKFCKECKTAQDKERDKLLEENIDEELDSKIVVYKIDTKTPLTGLIANKLQSKHNKTVFLVHEREDGEVAGSCRSPYEETEINIQRFCEESNEFNYASGHGSSFGVSWQKDHEKELYDWINSLDLPDPYISVLGSYTPRTIPKSLFSEFENKQYFGQGMKDPLVHFKISFTNKDVRVMGANGRTVKLEKDGISFMWFMITNADKEFLTSDGNHEIELVGTLGINEWNGRKYSQIIVDKMEIVCYNKEKSINDIF